MKDKIKPTIYAVIIGIVINLFSSIIYSKINNINFYDSFIEIWKWILTFILGILNYKLALYIIIIIIAIILFGIKIYMHVCSSAELSRPEFMKYVSDNYKGINYQWQLKRYGNSIEIENFMPVCECGAHLTTKSNYKNSWYSQPKLFCVNCDKIIEADFNDQIMDDARLYVSNKLHRIISIENSKHNH